MLTFGKQKGTKGIAKRLALLASAAFCAGGLLAPSAFAATSAAGAAADAANEFSKTNEARQELLAQERKIAESGQAAAVKGAKNGQIVVPVSSLTVQADGMTKENVLRLLPEAGRTLVNIHEISKEIQLLNDGGAMKASADFQTGRDGYTLVLDVKQQKKEQVAVTVSNTGNDYTGNWRVATSYVDRNISGNADTLGVAYVTSPSGGHISDVQQGALAYRLPMHNTDALTLTASYSDVDLGSLSHTSLFDIGADGKGVSAALHYQRYLAYTSREKDGFDLGINYWKMKNTYTYRFGGISASDEMDYDVATASLMFQHSNRDAHQAFAYQAGVETNLGTVSGDKEATAGCDKTFQILKAGTNYSYRTAGDWIFGLRAEAQYTNRNLVPALQLGAGGRTSVRGFMERAIAADKGIVGSLEIYTPQFAPGSRFLLFLDGARLTNNNDAALFDHENIASWGIGYRYNDPQKRWTVAVDYADILKDVEKDWNQQHKRWNMLVSYSF